MGLLSVSFEMKFQKVKLDGFCRRAGNDPIAINSLRVSLNSSRELSKLKHIKESRKNAADLSQLRGPVVWAFYYEAW